MTVVATFVVIVSSSGSGIFEDCHSAELGSESLNVDVYSIGRFLGPKVEILKGSKKRSINQCVTLICMILLATDSLLGAGKAINVVVDHSKQIFDRIIPNFHYAF